MFLWFIGFRWLKCFVRWICELDDSWDWKVFMVLMILGLSVFLLIVVSCVGLLLLVIGIFIVIVVFVGILFLVVFVIGLEGFLVLLVILVVILVNEVLEGIGILCIVGRFCVEIGFCGGSLFIGLSLVFLVGFWILFGLMVKLILNLLFWVFLWIVVGDGGGRCLLDVRLVWECSLVSVKCVLVVLVLWWWVCFFICRSLVVSIWMCWFWLVLGDLRDCRDFFKLLIFWLSFWFFCCFLVRFLCMVLSRFCSCFFFFVGFVGWVLGCGVCLKFWFLIIGRVFLGMWCKVCCKCCSSFLRFFWLWCSDCLCLVIVVCMEVILFFVFNYWCLSLLMLVSSLFIGFGVGLFVLLLKIWIVGLWLKCLMSDVSCLCWLLWRFLKVSVMLELVLWFFCLMCVIRVLVFIGVLVFGMRRCSEMVLFIGNVCGVMRKILLIERFCRNLFC